MCVDYINRYIKMIFTGHIFNFQTYKKLGKNIPPPCKNKEFFRHQWGRIFLFDKGQSFLPEDEKKESLFFGCEHSANSTDFWSIESLSYSWIKKPRCIFYLKSRQFFFFFGFSCSLCFLRNKVGMHMCLLLIFFL